MSRAPVVYRHRFDAMASPCAISIEGLASDEAARLCAIGEAEARRIEAKFTRYRPTGIVHAINSAQGAPVACDTETAGLIAYAERLHAMSGGAFDITSGVLRRVWHFDGSDRLPDPDAVQALRPLVGWDKVGWRDGTITLPPGMEIDLGGLCKEYAVDRVAQAIAAQTPAPVLVSFGGDLRATAPKAGGKWLIAIEKPDGEDGAVDGALAIGRRAIATSGDARRFLLRDGLRYSHILDPRTLWPVEGPPRAITVAAATCLEAGTLSTLAMLQGGAAETFLQTQGIEAWVHW